MGDIEDIYEDNCRIEVIAELYREIADASAQLSTQNES